MIKKAWYLIILIISTVVALILGLSSDYGPKAITSSILIGIWICFTLLFLQKIQQLHEFSSPHNRGFLILGALIFGVFYSYWGIFTGILAGNITENSSVYISIWTMIFGFPYLLYSLFQIWKSFRKYYSVYFGMKSVDGRTFAIMSIIFTYIFEIILSAISYGNIESIEFNLSPNYSTPNFILLSFSIILLIMLIVYGLINRPVDVSNISTGDISRRIERISQRAEQNANSAREAERRAEEAKKRQEARRRQKEKQIAAQRKQEKELREREKQARIQAQRKKKAQMAAKNKRKTKKVSKKKSVQDSKSKAERLKYYKQLRPKASILSDEDFKCIFCFEHIRYPEDKSRGVVLCPVCNYPAHADEFKDWARNSPLCSRCDGTIPTSFRRNPKIVPAKDYHAASRFWLKRLKN